MLEKKNLNYLFSLENDTIKALGEKAHRHANINV